MTLTLETLERLVGYQTLPQTPTVEIVAFIEEFLNARGARTHRLPSKNAHQCGLYAEIGPQAEGGILLSGHLDVVPVAGQDWQRTPFALTQEGDRFFGRGTTDMKGYVACMLNAADQASRMTLKEPLKLVFSYDEEIGCVGIQEILKPLSGMLGRPRCCFVGEPTEMQIAVGHKGKAAMQAVCHGQAGHSALAPQFVNALHMATDLVSGLRQVQNGLMQNGAKDAAYDIPFSTVHVGKMSGGTALNIVPDRAELSFEMRHLAGDHPADLLQQIQTKATQIQTEYRKTFDGASIVITQMNAYPGLDVPAGSPAVALAQNLLQAQATTKVAFGTEAGFFAGLDIPTLVCGPGSMAGQGHKPDEYIELGQLTACEAMLGGVVDQLTS